MWYWPRYLSDTKEKFQLLIACSFNLLMVPLLFLCGEGEAIKVEFLDLLFLHFNREYSSFLADLWSTCKCLHSGVTDVTFIFLNPQRDDFDSIITVSLSEIRGPWQELTDTNAILLLVIEPQSQSPPLLRTTIPVMCNDLVTRTKNTLCCDGVIWFSLHS